MPDEVLLVHGAAGASGLAAVEIGKALGARVLATAGSRNKSLQQSPTVLIMVLITETKTFVRSCLT
jgi:NADPH:quinone reductase-like Zn-dependent oxidoreductase